MSLFQNPQEITLKKLTSADTDDFMAWAADDEVTKFTMWDSYISKSEAENFIKNVVEIHPWFKAICLGNKVIGSITLDRGNGPFNLSAELGYVLAHSYWGKGYATQAVRCALQTGFADLGVERIEAIVDPDNIGSQRVLERNGFLKEGLLRKYLVHKGVLKDRFIYSVLSK